MYTDIYNAQLFRDLFKEKVCWSSQLGGWQIHNKKLWERDNNDMIKRFSIKAHENLQEQIKSFYGNKEATELFARHVKSSGSNAKLEAMLDCAKAYLSVPSHTFDAKDNFFNCNNGTFNLTTHTLQPFSYSDFLTKISPVDYIPSAKCPTWDRFINDIFLGRQDLILFFQKALGYSLTTSMREQCMFILYGGGRNGKSTLVETISKIFADYSLNCPASTFTDKHGTSIPNDIARLRGARLVTSSETKQSITLDESLIKQLTGGDRMTARFLHKEFFDFYPTFKIFLSTNHKPNIRGTDTGIWRRIRMIPFDLKLEIENEDKELPIKLKNELPGILNWIIEGHKLWQEQGLTPPQIVQDATIEYQDEEDDLGQFIKDMCMPSTTGHIPVHTFKNRIKEVLGYAKSQKTIGEYMKRHGFTQDRIYVDGARIRVWQGLRFLSAFEE